MSSTTSNVSPRQDTYWWQGSVMEIKARAEDTGGALGVLEGRFFEEGYGEEGGVPAGESAAPRQQEYDLEAAAALAKRYGFEVVGPQLA